MCWHVASLSESVKHMLPVLIEVVHFTGETTLTMALNITLQLQVARAPPAACFCSSAIAHGFGKPQGPGWQEPPASS